MTSCEPTRSSAYGEDLCWRIVWQTLAMQIPTKQVAIQGRIQGGSLGAEAPPLWTQIHV